VLLVQLLVDGLLVAVVVLLIGQTLQPHQMVLVVVPVVHMLVVRQLV
jgi:hypothetical protein